MQNSNRDDVGTAFELLIETLARWKDDEAKLGADAFHSADLAAVQNGLSRVELGVELIKRVSELHGEWMSRSGGARNQTEQLGNVPKETPPTADAGEPVTMRANKATAKGLFRTHGTILLAGSQVCKKVEHSLSAQYQRMRAEHLDDGTLAPEPGDPSVLRLTKSIRFGSQSGAAQYVAGYSTSGNRDWTVDADSSPLGQWLAHR